MGALGWNYPVFGPNHPINQRLLGVIANEASNSWLNSWPPQPYEAPSFFSIHARMYFCNLVEGIGLKLGRSNYFYEFTSTRPEKEETT